MRRAFVMALCVCLMLTVVSCVSDNESVQPQTTLTTQKTTAEDSLGTGLLQLYFSSSDSLNPYKAVTDGNRRLAPLLFDSLTKLDADLNPVCSLASSVTVSGRSVVITMRNAQFSDGSAVTAEDVTYSLQLAKSSKTAGFKDQLSEISGYSAASTYTVSLTLNRYDPLVASILDFPVVKRGTTSRENDEGKELPPIGSGRYVFKEDRGSYTLTPNKQYHDTVPKNTITLVHTPDTDALDYNIKVGGIDLYYSDMHEDTVPSMNGQLTMVRQTNFVFLGVNQNYGVLTKKDVRQAIAYALNRNELATDAYSTYAEAALSPFPTTIKPMKKAKNLLPAVENEQKVVEHLRKVGYNNKNESGFYINGGGSALALTLLYNNANIYQSSAASAIKKQLEPLGISCTLIGKPFSQYQYDVKHGNYQLYLGEVQLNKNFDLSALFEKKLTRQYTTKRTTTTKASATESRTGTSVTTKATAASKTAKPVTSSKNTYAKYLEGKASLSEFLRDFNKDLPFIPVVYRCGALCYSASIPELAVGTVSDVYYNMEQLSSNEDATKTIKTEKG